MHNLGIYWNDITNMAIKQRAKGIAEYGQGLEDNHLLTPEQIIDMAMEEAVDNLFYLAHLKATLKKEKSDARDNR